MERDPNSFLWDARESADNILRFVAGTSEEQYLANEMLQAAVERHFVIIGEALGRLAKVQPALSGLTNPRSGAGGGFPECARARI